jgi:uncharacterized protein (TIGR00730 family)
MSSDAAVPADDARAVQRIVDAALFNLWASANQLARIRDRSERYRVTVFGSSRLTPEQPLYGDVERLARTLTELGCDIVTGGGPGLMEAANLGARLGDPGDLAESVGIRVDLPFEQGANPSVEAVYTHATFFTRLHHFARLSDAFVVVDGGIGTTLELLMVWQLLQVRHLAGVPLIVVGAMWRELVAWAQRTMVDGAVRLASPEDVAVPTTVDTVDQAIALLAPLVAAHRQGTSGG